MSFKKYLTRKNILIASAFIAAGLSFLVAKQVLAGSDEISSLLLMITNWLAQILIYVFGQLLLIAISILIKVASFNDFVNADIVTIGWVIMRDVANLAIVVVMLIIAFGTTLNKNQYHYKTLLPKLILAAILVNFSKSITGILIDASQLLMMTFVHAFESIAAGNITYGLGIEDMLSVRSAAKAGGAAAEINDWNVMGALILGVVMLAVGLGVVVSLAIMFLYRIVVLWLLIIFSPIAFVGNLLPGAAQYVGQWRSMLTNYLVKGPTLAFMFWLSMTVLSQITESNRLINLQMQSQQAAFGVNSSAVNYAYFASKMSSPQRVFDYLVTVILFIFTMKTAAASGVLGASVAGNIMGKFNNVGRWIQKRPGVIGKRAWERTKTSHVGEGVKSLVQRGKTSYLGKKVGFDKEYSEQQAALRKARMTEALGGKRGAGAMERYEWAAAMKKRKDNEEKGVYKSEGDTRIALKNAKNLDDAMAAMQQLSNDKKMTRQDADEFTKKWQSGGRELKYANAFWDTQAAKGDKTAAFNRNVKQDEFGNYVSRSDDDAVKDIQKVYGKMKTSDMADSITGVTLLDHNNKAGQEFINIASTRTDDMGRGFSAQERKNLLNYTENAIAADDAGGGKIFKDNVTRKNYVKMRNMLKGMQVDGAFDKQTGRVKDNLVTEAEDLSGTGAYVSGYTNQLAEKFDSATFAHSSYEGTSFLEDKKRELVKGNIEKGKKERITGTHKETDFEKAVKKEVIPNISINDEMKAILKYRDEIATIDDSNSEGKKELTGKVGNLANEMRNSIIPHIVSEVGRQEIRTMKNPETGKNYKGKDLVDFEDPTIKDKYKRENLKGEFVNTEIYKLVEQLSQNDLPQMERKNILHLLDNLIIDIQNSANWKDRTKQFLLRGATMKGTPTENRQKARQEILVTARKLKTSLDALKDPQTKSRMRSVAGVLPVGKRDFKESNESRKVAATISDLANITDIISDLVEGQKSVMTPVIKDKIKDLNAKYDAYKKAEGQAKIDLVNDMQTLARDIASNFEV